MTEVKLHDIGEGMTEAEIIQILVEPGLSVSVDQPLVEIQTDKLTAELPSPVAGVVEKIHAQVGDVVEVGNTIMTVSVKDETHSSEPKTEEQVTNRSVKNRTDERAKAAGEKSSGRNPKSEHVLAVPYTRKIARDLGVDIEQIAGTGPFGRVIEEDLYAFSEHRLFKRRGDSPDNKVHFSYQTESGKTEFAQAEFGSQGSSNSPIASPAVRKLARQYGVDLQDIQGRDPFGRIRIGDVNEQKQDPASPQRTVQTQLREGKEIPFRGRRRAIAKKMSQSMFTIPHVTHFDEVDVTEIFEVKKSLKEVDPEKNVSVAAFYIKALQFALQAVPIFNAKLDEENAVIRLEEEYNIGIATDTEDGLIVPVIKNVERLSVFEIHTQMKNLIKKAKENQLTAKDISGGTFTVSNVGPMGSTGATPIINYPECALMAFHKTKKVPVVRDDDEIVIRQMMNVSMTFDHRVADGAKAVKFTNQFIKYIENPNLLLVEIG